MLRSRLKYFRNKKKAYSTGFTWVFGLVSLFGLGVLYITFSQVFEAHLVPTIKEYSNSSTWAGRNIDEETTIKINEGIDRYMTFFHLLPIVLFFLVILYMVIAGLTKERENMY